MRAFSLLFCLTVLLGLTTLPTNHAAAQSTPVAYKALTQQSGWLNTSRALTAEDLQGRIVLLDFWTYCCINCIHVIPDLHYLEEKFGNKLLVIGVHSAKFDNEKDDENIRQAMLRYGIEHPVVNDFDFRIWRSFGVRAWPSFILIGPDGEVVQQWAGEGNRNAIDKAIQALIRESDTLNTSPLPIALEKSSEPATILRFPGKLEYIPDYRGEPSLAIADSSHNRVVISGLNGGIRTVIGSGKEGTMDGAFATATFHTPQGLLYRDGMLYIADTDNHLLRAADLRTNMVSTLAGTGTKGYDRTVKNAKARSVDMASPWDLAFYPDADHITIAMAGTHQLWVYNIADKTVSVFAGNGRESIDDGSWPFNSLSQPSGLSVTGDKLYLVDSETSSLRVMQGDELETLIGSGLFTFGYESGKKGEALMQHPLGVYADGDNIYIADAYNHAIRRYNTGTEHLYDYAGTSERGNKDGNRRYATFNEPNDVLRVGDTLYVADTNNHAIRKIGLKTGRVDTLQLVPKAENKAPGYSEILPNIHTYDAMPIQPKQVQIRIELEQGWKINDEAPSFLALYDRDKKVVGHWGREELKTGRITLPELTPNSKLTLQGTFYYCEDKPNALCLIHSVEQPVQVQPVGRSLLRFNVQ